MAHLDQDGLRSDGCYLPTDHPSFCLELYCLSEPLTSSQNL